MLDEAQSAAADGEVRERDEQSMQVMEYALALVAVGAALLLAVLR